ncbi:hypothetical protein [Salipiger aestuarii]|uniref:hypothetical protein n=1 Tax=Salipiger aestuarii TaxID=568098 RepID=UPI00123B64B5|nr:hypothetical protein [Salipiger aestuarii]
MHAGGILAAGLIVVGLTGAGVIGAGPGIAATAKPDSVCEVTARLVSETVAARAAGQSKARARKPLHAALGADAGNVLAEWVWTLPEDQLTPAVGQAWKDQCEAQ